MSPPDASHPSPSAATPGRSDQPPAGPIVVISGVGADAAGAGLKVAGLTLVERSARQLVRQGHRVILAADPIAVPRPRRFFWPAGAQIVEATSPTEVAALAQTNGAARIVPANQVRIHTRDATGTVTVTDATSRQRAEDTIFRELLRGDLGLVARTLNKPVSFRITRYLFCRLPITPNQVTLLAAAIALCGAYFIAQGTGASMILGYFLAHVQSVLDGCDGELARVRFQQSAIGEWLDTIVDDGLNLTLAIATGVGLWRHHDNELVLFGGLAAGGMLAIYNAIAYRELVRQGEGGEVLKIKWWFAKGVDLKQMHATGKRSPLTMIGSLTRRDFFVFAWLVLAVVGLPVVILPYIFAIALGCFIVAVGQLFARR
ncbi:MAG TPA: CDP-alcohol phosphatidyltransferase family protein [Polyangia bacterium]